MDLPATPPAPPVSSTPAQSSGLLTHASAEIDPKAPLRIDPSAEIKLTAPLKVNDSASADTETLPAILDRAKDLGEQGDTTGVRDLFLDNQSIVGNEHLPDFENAYATAQKAPANTGKAAAGTWQSLKGIIVGAGLTTAGIVTGTQNILRHYLPAIIPPTYQEQNLEAQGQTPAQANRGAVVQASAEMRQGLEHVASDTEQIGKNLIKAAVRSETAAGLTSPSAMAGFTPAPILPAPVLANAATTVPVPAADLNVPEHFLNPANPHDEFASAIIAGQLDRVISTGGGTLTRGTACDPAELKKLGVQPSSEYINAYRSTGDLAVFAAVTGPLNIVPAGAGFRILSSTGRVLGDAPDMAIAKLGAKKLGEGITTAADAANALVKKTPDPLNILKTLKSTLKGQGGVLTTAYIAAKETGVLDPVMKWPPLHVLAQYVGPVVAGAIAARLTARYGLKALSLGGRALSSDLISSAVGATASGALRGTVAMAPFAVTADNQTDAVSSLMLGATAGAGIGGMVKLGLGSADALSRMDAYNHAALLDNMVPNPMARFVGTRPGMAKFETMTQGNLDALNTKSTGALANSFRAILDAKGKQGYVLTPEQMAQNGLPDAEGVYEHTLPDENGNPQKATFWVLRGNDVHSLPHEAGHDVVNFARGLNDGTFENLVNSIPDSEKQIFYNKYLAAAQSNPTILKTLAADPNYLPSEMTAEILGQALKNKLSSKVSVGRLRTLLGAVGSLMNRVGAQNTRVLEPGGGTTAYGIVPDYNVQRMSDRIVNNYLNDPKVDALLRANPVESPTPAAPGITEPPVVTPDHLASIHAIAFGNPELAQSLGAIADKINKKIPLTSKEEEAWAELNAHIKATNPTPPPATTGLSPEHENVLAGLSKVMGAKGMLKLNAVAEKVRAGQPLTEDEQNAWRGVDQAAVKAGAKSVGLGGKAPETPAPTPGAPTPEPTPGAPKARNPEIGEKRIEAAKNISQAVEETGSEPLKALAAGGAHEVEYSHAEGEKEGQVQRHEAVNTPEARARTTGEVLRTKVTLLDALKTKAGDWVARLFNHDVFGQNLAVAVKAIKKANLENRVPYTLGDRGIVGEADQARFKDDLRKYTENQHNGYRGDGGTLIRPVGGKSFIPEETPGYTPQPLSDPRASDFLNLLMGERPPKTTRGGAAHLEHQDIAKLNAGPVHPIPGLEYAGANAGRSVANTTNLRNDLMQAGADVSDMKPVHEDKRVDRITAATPVAGEAKVAAPVVATTAAGFMPRLSDVPENERGPGKEVTIRRADGTEYQAMSIGKVDNREWVGRATENRKVSHGLLGKGETIVENPAFMPTAVKSYADAPKDRTQNPYVRLTDAADNSGRSLMVQFSSDLLYKGAAQDDAPAGYYDKLYSGARKGYARMDDFWEIPQWVGFAAKILPESDFYVVRDMAKAKEFLDKAGYDHLLFSALDVNRDVIKEIAEAVHTPVEVGGYTDKNFFKDVKNVTWHDTMESMAKKTGSSYVQGVDYRHFKGASVIPRLTMSTGCKYQCAFCSIEKTVVPSSDEFVNQQADAIAGLGSQLVYLNDKTFGQSANYATLPEVGERIKAKNPNFKGFVIQTTAPVFSKFDPAWLKKSGIRYVELGIESYNDPILRSVNKPATEATMDRAAQVARENNIALIPNVIIGLPGETAETYAHTLSYLKANEDIISHANIYNLAIYKNTKLGKSLTTASPDDFNENVLEKSFHNDQQVHRVFAGDLYGTANKLLDKTPPGANYMPKANYLDSKDDFLREVVGDRMHYVPLNSTFTDNKGGSFMPAKNESKEANEGTTGWLLPDHTFRALAPSPNAGHEGYLAEHTEELNKKFGTSFDVDTVNDENARVDALNKGFVRWRNYGGALAVEANERYWGGQRNSILKRLVNTQDEFSHLKINVLTDGGKWLAGNSVNLLTVPDKESAIREAVQGVMIPEGTPVNPEPTLIQRARALPGEEGMPAFMPSTKPGAIVSVASRDNNTGKIYTGTWHGDANLKYMRQRFPDDSEDINNLRAVAAIDDPHYPLTAGFVTNKGEFLNRTEAYDRAIQLKQASPENYVNKELESFQFNKETARNPEAFLPKTEAGRDLEKRGFLFSEEDYGGGTLVFHINRPGLPEPIARMTVIQHDPNTAHVASVFTAPAYRGQRLAETLYRELGARLQNLGIGKLTGRVIHEAPLRIRTKLFGPATADEVTPLPGAEGVQAHYITHPVSPVTKFMPAEQKMKDMNMYVVRHGETILNAEGKMRGWNNPPLNSAGLKEAQNAAEQLTGHGIRRIATSDLQRAHQTANIIGKHLGVPVEVDRGLRPWGFGPKIEDMLSEKAAPIVERLVAHPDQRPEGVYSNGEHPESFNEYRHRIFSTLERLHQENPDGKTAVVTHYRTMKALEARTVGHEIDPKKFSERGEDRPGSLAYVRNGVLRHGLPRYLPVKAVKGLIGQTDENSLEGDPVQAKEFRNLRSSSAEHELWFGDASPEGEVARWRYVPDTQTLYWWFKNDVSSKAREMTREYLKDHGYDVKLERDVESNFDAAHGFMPRVKNPKAAPPEIEEFKNLKTMPEAFNKPNWAIVTATREMWGSATSDQNMRANDKLEGELFGRGFSYAPVSGSYKGVDQGKSFLISGITPQQALDLGRDYGQESVLVPQGYLYHDGTLAPVDPQNTVIGPAAQKQDGWSQVKGGEPFSLGINFAKRVPSGLEQSKPVQTGLFGDEEGEKVRLRNMSPKQLVAKYPEIVKPKLTESGKLQQVPYDLEEGTNFKGLKTREEKVKYVSDKLVAEASRLEKTPEFQDGLHWYSEFVPKLKKWFGKHAQIFAELLAATSPQTNVGTNFLYARKAFEGWVKGDYDAKISKFNEGMEMAANGKLGNWYRHSVPEPIQERNPSRAAMIAAWVEEHDLIPTQPERASYEPFTGKKTKLEINFGLHGRRVLQVLARRWMAENQGLKVAQFVGNLTGKSHGATIDVWAARLLRRLAYDNAKPWRILPEQETAVSDSDFKFGQDAFALAAKKLNLKPNALQAALWFVEKRYWNNKGWGKLDFGDFRNELENFVTKKKYEAVQGDLLGGKDILPLTKVQSNVKLGHEAVQALPPEARDLFNVKG